MKRTLTALTAAVFALAMMAGPAAAHHLVVDPPGQGEGPGEDAWCERSLKTEHFAVVEI